MKTLKWYLILFVKLSLILVLGGFLATCSPTSISTPSADSSTNVETVSETPSDIGTQEETLAVEPSPTPTQTSGELRVHFIDVGQGDSILIDLNETEVLIDGGDKSPGVVAYLTDYVNGPLEVMVATHPHADHIGGLIAVLTNFKVDNVWLNGDTSNSTTYDEFMVAVNVESANIHTARRGDNIRVGDLSLDVLNPSEIFLDSTNNRSIVLLLHYGDIDFLFTGDAEIEAEASMLAASLISHVEILKVGHHGSKTASSEQFFQACQPEVAIYMAGVDNRYGHPHDETIAALTEIGAEIYGTDTCGTIVVTSDEKSFSVQSEKQCRQPVTPPEPARFIVSNLSISPKEIKTGESVTISVEVSNSGSTIGTHASKLKINGSELATKSLTLTPAQNQTITFTVKIESGGTYTVEVDGLEGIFTVTDTTSKPIPDCTCYSYTLKRYIPCEQATAICSDGTCSVSKSRSGTCSHHGGVARWLK